MEILAAPAIQPPTDIYETDAAYVVEMEMAGCQTEDIEATFCQGVLSVCCERRPSFSCPGRGCQQLEIEHGPIARDVPIPAPVDESAITAKYVQGILTITIPKSPRPPGRSIEVNRD